MRSLFIPEKLQRVRLNLLKMKKTTMNTAQCKPIRNEESADPELGYWLLANIWQALSMIWLFAHEAYLPYRKVMVIIINIQYNFLFIPSRHFKLHYTTCSIFTYFSSFLNCSASHRILEWFGFHSKERILKITELQLHAVDIYPHTWSWCASSYHYLWLNTEICRLLLLLSLLIA